MRTNVRSSVSRLVIGLILLASVGAGLSASLAKERIPVKPFVSALLSGGLQVNQEQQTDLAPTVTSGAEIWIRTGWSIWQDPWTYQGGGPNKVSDLMWTGEVFLVDSVTGESVRLKATPSDTLDAGPPFLYILDVKFQAPTVAEAKVFYLVHRGGSLVTDKFEIVGTRGLVYSIPILVIPPGS